MDQSVMQVLSNTSVSTIIKEIENKPAIQTAITSQMFAVANAYGEANIDSISIIMDSLYEEFAYEPIESFVEMVKVFASGKRKVYGRITPFDCREVMEGILETKAIEREREHEQRKGSPGNRNTLTLREALSKITTQH